MAGKPGFSRYSRPAGLKLNTVHIEVLNDLRPQGVTGLQSILDLTISEDGAQATRYLHNREKNDASIGLVVQTLSDLLANPMQTFAEQSDRCCCCGKKLSDITSRLRGIGPECIRYFVGVEEVAAKIRHKFRCLDDEWAA